MRRIARWCAVVLLALALPAAAVAQRYLVPGEGPLNSPPTALAPTLWFVELESPPLAEATTTDPARYLDRLRKEKQDFRNAARAARIQFFERFTFDTLWNGVSVRIAPRHLLALSRLPGVAALYPAGAIEAPPSATPISGVESSPELFTALGMTGATIAQAAGHTGAGVRVAVMDTGIDYLHPDLGGGFGPGFKVAGGY